MTKTDLSLADQLKAFCYFTIKYLETDKQKYLSEAMEYRALLIKADFNSDYLDGIVDGLKETNPITPFLTATN